MSYYDDFVEPNATYRFRRPWQHCAPAAVRIPCPLCGKPIADNPTSRWQHTVAKHGGLCIEPGQTVTGRSIEIPPGSLLLLPASTDPALDRHYEPKGVPPGIGKAMEDWLTAQIRIGWVYGCDGNGKPHTEKKP